MSFFFICLCRSQIGPRVFSFHPFLIPNRSITNTTYSQTIKLSSVFNHFTGFPILFYCSIPQNVQIISVYSILSSPLRPLNPLLSVNYKFYHTTHPSLTYTFQWLSVIFPLRHSTPNTQFRTSSLTLQRYRETSVLILTIPFYHTTLLSLLVTLSGLT